jgi:hypothetical protein
VWVAPALSEAAEVSGAVVLPQAEAAWGAQPVEVLPRAARLWERPAAGPSAAAWVFRRDQAPPSLAPPPAVHLVHAMAGWRIASR